MTYKKNKVYLAGILVLLICTAAFLAGCKAGKSKEGDGRDNSAKESSSEEKAYDELSAKEAKALIDSNDDIVVIDARTRKEYDYMHVSGAVLIPSTDIGDKPLADIPDLDRQILVYSRSTTESRQVAEKLTDAGYKNVSEFGSMESWPYAVEMSDDSAAAFT